MSLAVLVPYRADTPQREQIYETTRRLWQRVGVDPIYADDGLTGLFSLPRAANRARALAQADCLVVFSVDALPLPFDALLRVNAGMRDGTPWTVLFDGQQRFTPEQTAQLIAGTDPAEVGPAAGPVAMGREAILAVRSDVWDDLRGMDERFVGWGPEDRAFHHVLRTLHPDGCDVPAYGLFQTLAHPETTRAAFPDNDRLWRSYPADAAALRAWYLDRP